MSTLQMGWGDKDKNHVESFSFPSYFSLIDALCTMLFSVLVISGFSSNTNIFPLKLDGNEKLGGLRFLQLLGISLGPWRSMAIFILNVPFAIEKLISFSALSSKMNRRFV